MEIPRSVLEMPPDMRDGPDGTLTVFKYLMDHFDFHEVIEIDPVDGWPWIGCNIFVDGVKYHHKVSVEPECVELMQENSE